MGWKDGLICPSITQLPHSPITRSLVIDLYVVDDADDSGVDGTILQARRHPRGAAADDEHGFTDSGVDSIDRHQVVTFGFPPRIDRTDNEKLVADESWVLARGDHRPHDFGEQHGLRLGGRSLSDRQR